MHEPETIVVIGAGIVGLTTAVELQDAGYNVDIWTKDTLHNTCSAVAAAFWYPYVIQPEEAVQTWGISTLERFKTLANDPAAGIRKHKINAIFTEKTPDPLWAKDIPSFQRLTAENIPDTHCDGFCFETVAIEMSIFLPYIINKFVRKGGRLLQREISTFDEAFQAADTVINCTGLGARELCNDHDLTPVRGQVVCTKKGDLDEIYSDCDNYIYMVPLKNMCVFGGNATKGDWDLTPREADQEDILERCSATLPKLAGLDVIENRVGLRPARSCVRLEAEEWAPGKTLIHNYGHGGAGVTLSFGCADTAVTLVKQHANAYCVLQ